MLSLYFSTFLAPFCTYVSTYTIIICSFQLLPEVASAMYDNPVAKHFKKLMSSGAEVHDLSKCKVTEMARRKRQEEGPEVPIPMLGNGKGGGGGKIAGKMKEYGVNGTEWQEVLGEMGDFGVGSGMFVDLTNSSVDGMGETDGGMGGKEHVVDIDKLQEVVDQAKNLLQDMADQISERVGPDGTLDEKDMMEVKQKFASGIIELASVCGADPQELVGCDCPSGPADGKGKGKGKGKEGKEKGKEGKGKGKEGKGKMGGSGEGGMGEGGKSKGKGKGKGKTGAMKMYQWQEEHKKMLGEGHQPEACGFCFRKVRCCR